MEQQLRKIGAIFTFGFFGVFGSATVSAVEFRGHEPLGFTVEFEQCEESVGIYPVALSDVDSMVPDDYIIASPDGELAFAIFRAVECDAILIESDNQQISNGTDELVVISQVGIVIVPPQGTGDANNYTVHYGTNSKKLARALRKGGVKAKHVANLEFDYESYGDGTGEIYTENPRRRAQHIMSGPASDPAITDPGITFIANWWHIGRKGNVLMETTVDQIFMGDASQVIVTTNNKTKIAKILGGTVSAAPVYGIRGVFSSATMDIRAEEL